VVKRAGGVLDRDIARRKVVEVPSESTASPGVESVTIVAGLSPVKGATRQSEPHLLILHWPSELKGSLTKMKPPPLNPPR
jgi:hypothetical protein